MYPSVRLARSIDAVTSHTSEVFSVHSIGSLAVLTQRGTDPRVLGVAFGGCAIQKARNTGKSVLSEISSQYQLYSGE